jgi:hypothetical protein
MSTNVGKKGPGSIVRQHTQQGRDLAAAAQRLQDQYFAGLARAQAHYIASMQRLMDTLSEPAEADVVHGESPAEQAELSGNGNDEIHPAE